MARIGIVLSGGMLKGAYQIGALKGILNHIPLKEITCLSGASIGALNGFALATDNLPSCEELWQSFKSSEKRHFIGKLIKDDFADVIVDKLCEKSDLLIPHLYVPLLNTIRKRLEYIDLATQPIDQIADLLRATVCLPPFNNPIVIGKEKYYDGAMVDNIPTEPLMAHNLDYIICVYFDNKDYVFENSYFDNKVIKLNFINDSFLKNSLTANHESILQMIDIAYDKTSMIMESVFKNGTDDLEFINRRIQYLNSLSNDKHIRITGDIIVAKFNKAMKKIFLRK